MMQYQLRLCRQLMRMRRLLRLRRHRHPLNKVSRLFPHRQRYLDRKYLLHLMKLRYFPHRHHLSLPNCRLQKLNKIHLHRRQQQKLIL
jgi:hypothetical protein